MELVGLERMQWSWFGRREYTALAMTCKIYCHETVQTLGLILVKFCQTLGMNMPSEKKSTSVFLLLTRFSFLRVNETVKMVLQMTISAADWHLFSLFSTKKLPNVPVVKILLRRLSRYALIFRTRKFFYDTESEFLNTWWIFNFYESYYVNIIYYKSLNKKIGYLF